MILKADTCHFLIGEDKREKERESISSCKIHSVKSAALYSTQQSILHSERPEKENYMIHQAGYSNKLDS